MKRTLVLLLGTLAVTGGGPAPASAGDASAAPQARYYPIVAERLTGLGYADVRLLDAAAREMVATDPEGRDVLLVIHPRNGTIESWQPLPPPGPKAVGQRGRGRGLDDKGTLAAR